MKTETRKAHPFFYTKEFGLIHEIQKEEQRSRQWSESSHFQTERRLVDGELGVLGEVEAKIERQLITPAFHDCYLRQLWPLVCNRIILPLCGARLMLRSGYYNESGTILRSVAEALLLFVLFNHRKDKLQKWLRGAEFRIGNVKNELGYENDPLYLKYKELCRFVHVNERSICNKIAAGYTKQTPSGAFRSPIFNGGLYRHGNVMLVSMIVETVDKITHSAITSGMELPGRLQQKHMRLFQRFVSLRSKERG